MAGWSAVIPSWTPVPVADGIAMTDNGHHTIQGGSALQRGELRGVYIGGQAVASAVTNMVLGRTSTVGGALTALRLVATDPGTNVLSAPMVSYAVSTTKPQRSATAGMILIFSFNPFGGLVNWNPNPGEVIAYQGNTAPLGELTLNAFTGTAGLLGSRLLIETP